MTQINKLVMHGFKSFADRTELLFGDRFNVVLGPNGSGKCITGDSLVTLSNGSLIPIKDILMSASEKKDNLIEEIDDGVIIRGDGPEILCLNTKSMKIEGKKVKAFVKRTSPETLLQIRTKTGRQITATKYHPLFILENDRIVPIKAEDLKTGKRIAVPRALKIDEDKKEKIFYELLDLIDDQDGIYVPYSDRLVLILNKIKDGEKRTWKEIAREINIPYNAIKGLIDKQAINFAYIVKIARCAGLSDSEIISVIKEVKSKNYAITCSVPWKNSPEFARLLGYLLAEGRLSESNQIWFTNGDENIVQDYKYLIEDVFGIRATVNEYKSNCYDVIAYSTAAMKILRKFGMAEKTEKKTITNLFLSHASEEELINIINGLYSGDGYVSKNSIEITTKSRKLAAAIESILLRMGVIHHSKCIIKSYKPEFSGIYKQITAYGVDNFKKFDKINVASSHKNQRIKDHISRFKEKNLRINPNVDLVEANTLIKRFAKEHNIDVKKSRRELPKLDAYCYNQCIASRNGIKEILNFFSPQNSATATILEKLTESDILWDEIIEVEEIISKEKWVYDLCIDEHHNFIANNFFVHNSNVIDALCFVLGKSSSKSLRAEKSANLIYNGGKTRTAAKQGEVSIFFDNKKKTFPIDSDEVKISRIVRANGQSVYKINNKTRTRQEVVDLLSVAKINPDGYNIILQGDIVQFIEMSTVERRMIIEEIAGISIYEEKKQKALKALEIVDQKLNEAEIILAEREKQLKELKKDRDEAMKYKGLNDKINRNKASTTALQIKKKKTEKEEQDKIMAESKARIDELTVKIDELKKKIDEKKAEIAKIQEEIDKNSELEQLKIRKEVEQLKVDIATREQKITNQKEEMSKIETRKKQLGDSLKEVEEKLSSLVSEKKDIEADLAEKKKDLKLVEKKIDELKKKHSMENLGEIEKQINEIDKESDAKQAEVSKLREEQQNLFREKDRLELQIQNLDEKIEKVEQVEKENKDQVNRLKKKKEEFQKATLELNKLLNEDSSLAAQLNNAKTKLLKAEEELSKLKVKNASVRESLAGSEAVRRILDERTKFGGEVYGLISGIGQVEAKYAIALETAAGPKLKSIVVEDDATAARCIKYLKEKRLGVASFLPLNKIKGVKKDPEIEKHCKHKGALGFAMDFIEHDPKFKNVFSFVFGNTIVVENIDVAREIGIGNAKMVTLDGDMAETSGAMHGGWRQKKEKGLSFQEKDLVNEMKELSQKVDEHASVISKVEAKRLKNEDEIRKLREFKAGMEGDIITLQRTLHLESGDVDVSKKQKDLAKDDIKKVEKQADALQDKISELTGELARMKIKRTQLRSQSDGLRSPTVLAEMNAFEGKRSELKEKIARVEESYKQIKEKTDNIYGPEKEKTLKAIDTITKEGENFKKDSAKMKKENEQAAAELKEKEKKADKFRKQFKKLFETKDEINAEVGRLDKSVFLREDERRKNELIINNTQLAFSELTGHLQALEEEFKKYEGIELEDKSEEALKREFNSLERMMENMGNVNMRALEVYDTVEKEYNSLTEKKNKLKTEKEDVLVMMNEIETKKKDLFMKHFERVNETFKKFFSELSTKGDASLELENPQDPFQEGVMIKVKITGTKFMDIRSLSGGEKTMTALAFIFAIQEHDPASFYIMDEVDAALDKNNSIKLAHMIKKYADKAQYVVISHNDYLLGEADILYGVTMNEHAVSKVVSLKV